MAKETRTYEDRKAYLAKATNNRRRRLKQRLVELKGGKCQICGYSKYIGALDFHHVDPAQKSFRLSMEELYRSWDLIVNETEKCVLVCANCHREIHGGLIQLQNWKKSDIILPHSPVAQR